MESLLKVTLEILIGDIFLRQYGSILLVASSIPAIHIHHVLLDSLQRLHSRQRSRFVPILGYVSTHSGMDIFQLMLLVRQHTVLPDHTSVKVVPSVLYMLKLLVYLTTLVKVRSTRLVVQLNLYPSTQTRNRLYSQLEVLQTLDLHLTGMPLVLYGHLMEQQNLYLDPLLTKVLVYYLLSSVQRSPELTLTTILPRIYISTEIMQVYLVSVLLPRSHQVRISLVHHQLLLSGLVSMVLLQQYLLVRHTISILGSQVEQQQSTIVDSSQILVQR